MAYILKGRRVRSGRAKTPCIFCGRWIKHFTDGGTGRYVFARRRGKERPYIYCAESACPQRTTDELYENSRWLCGCSNDYVENVGDVCANCQTPRENPADINGEKTNLVYVRNFQLISRENLGDRTLERFRQDADAMIGGKTRVIMLGDHNHTAPALDYCEDVWFEEETDGNAEQD